MTVQTVLTVATAPTVTQVATLLQAKTVNPVPWELQVLKVHKVQLVVKEAEPENKVQSVLSVPQVPPVLQAKTVLPVKTDDQVHKVSEVLKALPALLEKLVKKALPDKLVPQETPADQALTVLTVPWALTVKSETLAEKVLTVLEAQLVPQVLKVNLVLTVRLVPLVDEVLSVCQVLLVHEAVWATMTTKKSLLG